MISPSFGIVAIIVVTTSAKGANDLRGGPGTHPEIHLAASSGWKSFTDSMRGKLDHVAHEIGAGQTTKTNPTDLQRALRMSPETYASLSNYFDRLDSDRNGMLHEVEFVAAVDPERLQVKGREIFELFVPSGVMSLQGFLRFAMVVLAEPSDFHWSEHDLKHLPTVRVWQDNDRLALLKLLMVFDVNSDGMVTMVEFENGWMGPLLWKLRNEGMLSSAWMEHEEEFEYANKVFDQRSGDDMQLDLTEWVHLLYEARDKSAAKSFARFGQYHLGFASALATVMPCVFA